MEVYCGGVRQNIFVLTHTHVDLIIVLGFIPGFLGWNELPIEFN